MNRRTPAIMGSSLVPNHLIQLTGADHVWPAPVEVWRRTDHVGPGADTVWPGADAVGPALRDLIPILPLRDSMSTLPAFWHWFSSLFLTLALENCTIHHSV